MARGGLQAILERHAGLDLLLGLLHENVLHEGSQMTKGAFDRLLLSLVRSFG